MTNTKNTKYIQYLNNLNSPFFKIKSTISKSKKNNNIVTLRKINNSKELALRLKPKLNKKNLIGSYTNLKNFTDYLKKNSTSQASSIENLSNSNEKLIKNSIFAPISNRGSNIKRPFILVSPELLKRDRDRTRRELILKKRLNSANDWNPFLKRYKLGVSSFLKSLYTFDVFLAKSQNIVYNFNRSKEKLIKNLENILHDAFISMSSLISRPVLEITASKIIIHLFFFFRARRRSKKHFRRRARNFFKKNKSSAKKKNAKKIKIGAKEFKINKNKIKNNKLNTLKRIKINAKKIKNNKNSFKAFKGFKKNNFFKKFPKRLKKIKIFNSKFAFLRRNNKFIGYLAEILSSYLNKDVQFELIRLHYPINESFILAKSIGILGNKIRRRFKYFVNASFKSAKINNPSDFKLKSKSTTQKKSLLHNASSSITGIKMKLGGRILAQRIVPRFTSQTFQEGSLTRSNASIVTSSRFTKKNRKGTYSITVSIGHRFF